MSLKKLYKLYSIPIVNLQYYFVKAFLHLVQHFVTKYIIYRISKYKNQVEITKWYK